MTSEESIQRILQQKDDYEEWYELLKPSEVYQILRRRLDHEGPEAAKQECARMLEHGSDAIGGTIIERREGYETALMLAVKSADMELMELLLTHGANPDIRAANGCSALSEAIVAKNQDIISLLLEHGAAPDAITVSLADSRGVVLEVTERSSAEPAPRTPDPTAPCHCGSGKRYQNCHALKE